MEKFSWTKIVSFSILHIVWQFQYDRNINPFGTAIWNNFIFSEISFIITYLEFHWYAESLKKWKLWEMKIIIWHLQWPSVKKVEPSLGTNGYQRCRQGKLYLIKKKSGYWSSRQYQKRSQFVTGWGHWMMTKRCRLRNLHEMSYTIKYRVMATGVAVSTERDNKEMGGKGGPNLTFFNVYIHYLFIYSSNT